MGEIKGLLLALIQWEANYAQAEADWLHTDGKAPVADAHESNARFAYAAYFKERAWRKLRTSIHLAGARASVDEWEGIVAWGGEPKEDLEG